MSVVPLSDLKDAVVEDTAVDDAEQLPTEQAEKHGTKNDHRDMTRMGKRQQLRRDFRFFSIFGYSVIMGGTWEFALLTGILSLTNGGTAGAIWMFLIVCFGMFFVMLSMAEMASMAPTAGGQYHWVSEFAPKKYQKVLSYAVGWLCVLGWQSAMVVGSYGSSQQFEALISLCDPSYEIKGWHGTLFSIAITLFCITFNTIFIRKLPLVEGVVIILHVFGFFAVLIVLWVMAPRSDAKAVLTTFEDNSGWGNVGLACLVSISGPVVTLIGADSACHLSEELKNAGWILPRAMIATATANYIMGFVMTITIMFTVGDVAAALASPTGQPYVAIIYNATQSKGGTVVIILVVAIMLIFATVNQVTTSSRQLWSFARDGGLPFSPFLARVVPGWDIPLNAILITMLSTCLLSLIVIGSTIAFNVLTTLSLTGLLSSYLIVIGCVLLRRLQKEPFPPSRFTLSKWGIVVNIIALSFLSVAFVMVFFPSAPHPSPADMNWSSLIYGTTVIFSSIYYYFRGAHNYKGPVEYVKKVI